jgi:hypothetical protein
VVAFHGALIVAPSKSTFGGTVWLRLTAGKSIMPIPIIANKKHNRNETLRSLFDGEERYFMRFPVNISNYQKYFKSGIVIPLKMRMTIMNT